MDNDIDIEGDEFEDEQPPDRVHIAQKSVLQSDAKASVSSDDISRNGTSTELLQDYPEPKWLSEQTEWSSAADADMDEQSRALIESMIAEEEFYFGQGTVTIASGLTPDGDKGSSNKRALSEGENRPTKKAKNEPAAVSHKVKWTKEEDENLREGIVKFGYGAWKPIAAFMKTRTPLQIKNHVRHLTVYGGVTFTGSENDSANDVDVVVPKLESDKAQLVQGAEEMDDVDIDITDEEGDGNQSVEDRPAFVLQPLSDAELTDAESSESGDSKQERDDPGGSDERENLVLAVAPLEHAGSTKMEVDTGGASNAEESTDIAEIADAANASTDRPVAPLLSDYAREKDEAVADKASVECASMDVREDTSNASNPVKVSPPEKGEPGLPVDVAPPEHVSHKMFENPKQSLQEKPSQERSMKNIASPRQKSVTSPSEMFTPAILEESMKAEPAIDSAIEIDPEIIQRFEVSSLPEWFLSTLALSQGKKPHPRTLHKTPDRYMKIRNYILTAWKKCKPKYLTKTSVRPGLKGEGDVNAIGRIHEFLENTGAINRGCPEKGGRKNYGMGAAKKTNKDEVADDLTEQEAGSVWNFLDEGQRRKRRIRNAQGDWVDENGVEAADPEAEAAREEMENAREEARLFIRNSKYFADEELEKFDKRLLKKRQRQQAPIIQASASDALGEYDPFRLIPTRTYTEEVPAPFRVVVQSNTMIVMDMHAHLAHTEIIGLLGGTYDVENGLLNVEDVFPCRSMSTGVQCEMDPDSEMQAREAFSAKGYDVVGWYHSHPTFDPIPSIRDIENQTTYQTLFQRGNGVEPFIGAIVTPYDARHAADRKSRFGWLSISHSWNSLNEYRLPYACNVTVSGSEALTGELFNQLSQLLRDYRTHEHRVDLMKPFAPRHDPIFTRLDKLIHSVESHANLVGLRETQPFITRLREIILRGYCGVAVSGAGSVEVPSI
ncbi:hypothetical protein PhCBS80983_g01635 [Powellomyces hirtus]|uniref:Uncharacterized protein n=1 Tax=Powellomyces hirtus TaxID=109895 RepID=A0A507ECB2_9FUNG|nr:hypothetical protein PhCBS80983_g01635 [Powellomyces hirtus]